MDIAYQDLYWGARYHLKRDEHGQFYLIGVKQKIFAVIGFVCLIPMCSSIVMAIVSGLKENGRAGFFMSAAVFLLILSFVFFSRRERFTFGRDRIAHCLGWRGLPLSHITFWTKSECSLVVLPIVEHKNGCWLQLNAKGEKVWRNSIGTFEQTKELALFLAHQHCMTVFDNVTKWPQSIPLSVRTEPEPKSASVDANNEYQISGSVWRLLLIFPVALLLGGGLYVMTLIGR
ncbi:hypothetical protein [Enterovibrio coralii]|uniref:hypothetical protein n=1 Tax=Enterovibrio coralii TaxID=294935 RepID=UPI000A61642F|nr:hypothetical protein [Enterovibrio coralii]